MVINITEFYFERKMHQYKIFLFIIDSRQAIVIEAITMQS